MLERKRASFTKPISAFFQKISSSQNRQKVTYGSTNMKKILLTSLLLLYWVVVFSQEKALKNYSSSFITGVNADKSILKRESLVHIIFLDPISQSSEAMDFDQLPRGFISFNFVRRNESPTKYTLKYLKTSKSKSNTIYWYVIIDYNEDYDVVKVVDWKVPLTVKGKPYKYTIYLSKYGNHTSPLYEMGFVSTRI